MLYGLKQLLFKRMQNDMGVMSEYADNILELWEEIDEADNDILAEYAKTFLTTEDTAMILEESQFVIDILS